MSSLKNLPVLPEASLRILDAINTPDIPIEKLADALSLSPGLVARLLGLANSAYFARGRNVSDIRTAIFQVLGLDLVKALAMAIIFNVQFDTRKCQGFDAEYFWIRSLTTAVSAQKLAADIPQLREFAPSAIYSGGLLLNIGVLVLGYLLPEELHDIFVENKKTRLPVSEGISRQMGQSHYQIGHFLLHKWHLPALYQLLLQNYENKDFESTELPLLILLRVCERLSATVIAGEPINLQEIEPECRKIELPLENIRELAEQLAENQPAMQKLAAIMGN
ncbi:HDOD domain-containing protein [Methylomonas rosea]|uniref:HDOD domain-containing protein n=1 Tax=Methylomonas rosea TaxID=2952227 RepID=A0ABT1TND4_9GAMM|nr:HDOD domain-containing protein [Methylomonas sp. WSC-7]MCQ8115891.1 HDOD domain-containing protein [Methylomonas sp. WSC-7]